MPNVDEKIQEIEKKIAQQREQLRDLKAAATRQERKDATRRKILYGAAYLAYLRGLTDAAREYSETRVHAQIHNAKDRAFLGLPALKPVKPEFDKEKERLPVVDNPNLPFGKE